MLCSPPGLFWLGFPLWANIISENFKVFTCCVWISLITLSVIMFDASCHCVEFKGMSSPSGHPTRRWDYLFMWTDLEKCSNTWLAHQWILCSEWVPSEWRTADKNITSNPHHSSPLINILWSQKQRVFISAVLDCHSDGTHSLQRILDSHVLPFDCLL